MIPELDHELTVWTDRRPLFEKLTQLDNTLADIYKHLDATSKSKPQIHSVLQQIKVPCSLRSETFCEVANQTKFRNHAQIRMTS